MTNPYKGDVAFEAGGKTYTLRYSHSALIKLERQLDRGLMSVINEMSDVNQLRIGTVVSILWAGLQTHHPNMSFEDAAGLLDEIEGGTGAVIPIIGDAFTKAFAAPGTKGTNPPLTGNGIGTGSLSTTSP